mmetsp:Transcript_42661/g.100056  ORF Transcript_42661/g.100056 Transcript_42661/m.100056 type:complete len:137 (-) Transcript_42661:744-1154(-)
MYLTLGNFRIPQNLFTRLHALLKLVHAQVFKPRSGNGGIVINSIKKRINFNMCLRRRRKSPLGPFTSSSEPTERTLVAGHVLFKLPAEILEEVINQSVVKIFSPQMCVSSCSFHFKNSLFDSQQRNIERSSTQIEN